MSLRVFRDVTGEEWKVWDVTPHPSYAGRERRRGDRRAAAAPGPGVERRTGRDRRRNPALLTPGLEKGWLCFDSAREKRRLTPIPEAWQDAPEPRLAELLERARCAPRVLAPTPAEG